MGKTFQSPLNGNRTLNSESSADFQSSSLMQKEMKQLQKIKERQRREIE